MERCFTIFTIWQKNEHCTRTVWTHHWTVRFGHVDQHLSVHPLRETKIVFTSSAKRCWFAFSWVRPYTGLLFQEVQVDTCRGTVIFPCADGSIKQEGHVVPRPHRLRLLLQEDQDAGGDFDAHRRSQTLSTFQQCERRLMLPHAKFLWRKEDLWNIPSD